MKKLIFKAMTGSPDETSDCGAKLASLIESDPSLPRFIALDGDLGTGKTEFVRGFVSVAAPGSAVRSPTYTLVNEYRAPAKKMPVFHFDVYRINNEDDLYSTGFYDYPDRGVCLVEWCELIPYALPESYISVVIEKTDLVGNDRKITVTLTVPDKKEG
ncbi:MAG: tRNA (adenosine(37)-N6)-threonylcarbamoyltransferase complex ATPase subunit type 1 TsaE [Clostridia bacterium]|nr:tRNA (adenosine(37)-N6)-threonylcarbamoyltransferase complex ATPase subunit type 1 TsaE [Clostridia bacterium]